MTETKYRLRENVRVAWDDNGFYLLAVSEEPGVALFNDLFEDPGDLKSKIPWYKRLMVPQDMIMQSCDFKTDGLRPGWATVTYCLAPRRSYPEIRRFPEDVGSAVKPEPAAGDGVDWGLIARHSVDPRVMLFDPEEGAFIRRALAAAVLSLRDRMERLEGAPWPVTEGQRYGGFNARGTKCDKEER